MEIKERAEATEIAEGTQVTRTSFADYFYFRKGRQIVRVRVPKETDEGKRGIAIDEWNQDNGR